MKECLIYIHTKLKLSKLIVLNILVNVMWNLIIILLSILLTLI